MVFSPNTFAGAPHGWLATLTEKNASAADDARLLNAVTRAFPAVTAVRVKDALDIVNRLVAQLGTAIRAAAGVALIASVLVLAGALAAGNRARIHDAVVLKTLGATRRTLIAAFSLEYMLIGLATAVFALAAGGVAAWFVVARIMTLPSHFMPEVAVATIGFALASRSASALPEPGGCWGTKRRRCCEISDPQPPESAHLRLNLVNVAAGTADKPQFGCFTKHYARLRSCSCRQEPSYSAAGMLEPRQRRLGSIEPDTGPDGAEAIEDSNG
ncbi:hypothetical protein AJ88_00370 [Mesorhizobium amorphae CCBAU 01583]|nr:hypothetical protein AJ88_00370 [Mesorhizobium amorphae CCBAU 01583]